MPRTFKHAPPDDPQAAIQMTLQSKDWSPPPGSRDASGERRDLLPFDGDEDESEEDVGGGTYSPELAQRAQDLFSRDSKSDGATIDVQRPVKPESAAELFRRRKAELPKKAVRAVADKTGGVRAIDTKGRTVKWLRKATRDRSGRFVSAADAAKVSERGNVESNALPRVVRIAKSWFGNQPAGASPARLRSVWEGYKQAHPEARGSLVVDGDRVLLRFQGRTLASTRISRPRNWRRPGG